MNWYNRLKTSGKLIELAPETLEQIDAMSQKIVVNFNKLYQTNLFIDFDKDDNIVNGVKLGTINVFNKYKNNYKKVRVYIGFVKEQEDVRIGYNSNDIFIFIQKVKKLKNNADTWYGVLVHEITHSIDPLIEKGERDIKKKQKVNPHYIREDSINPSYSKEDKQKLVNYHLSNYEIEAHSSQIIHMIAQDVKSDPLYKRKIRNWLATSNTFNNLPKYEYGIPVLTEWNKHPELVRRFKVKLWNYLFK